MFVEITVKQENQILTVFLKGELDHHTAISVKDTIDMLLVKTPFKVLVLDMAGVTFMDSSGIGLIAGRYNRVRSIGGSMKIANPSFSLTRILKMSGIEKLMKII
ncbi:MAG: anti-sigma factor antagonist [Clostridiaceae bacterium]|jgi:stage II sporulation protein AA (anti-sigma F factor antagonist)|nr:anti-sigma factor antagonist [Clostridiaceae bacterium]